MTEWIEDPDTLARAVDERFDAPLLAVDCESNAMHAHRARVCVVQIAVADPEVTSPRVVLVDTLRLGVGGPLGALLSASGPKKVFHDLGYDARILAAEGVVLGNSVDTAVQARMLGEPATGLASLLSKRFGLSLDKRFQHHDWALRPLRPDALRYLAGDVADLGRLYASLRDEVEALGIRDEVECETAWALRRALDDALDEAKRARPPFAKIKGYREMRGASRAALRELADARERLAAARDVPIGRILPNAVALNIARERPVDRARLLDVAGAQHVNAPWSAAWIDAVARALASPSLSDAERELFAREEAPRDRAERKERAARLTAWRREEAARRGVDVQVVLPGHCVEALSGFADPTHDDLASLEGLGESRRRRYGAQIIAAITAAPPASE
ncbi:MAG: HRDC domain-containing protein [Polyangiales bacterium]